MRWRVYVLFTWGWLMVALPMARADDGETLQAQYLKIYLKINDADQLERQGDYRGALADFKDCYARLQKIHNTDPSWESALVIHRMDDCRAKIVDLADRAAEQQSPSVTPDTNAPGGMAASPGSDDINALKQQLEQVEQELQDTKAKLQNSEILVTTLRSQLDSVNNELAALKSQQSVDSRMGQLLSENQDLTSKLSDAEKEIHSIKALGPKTALTLARTQLKNTQDQLAASEAANAGLQATTTTLRQQLDQAQSDLATANQKLAASPPDSAEYDTLKRENEVMRDILTRELQEQAHRDMAKRLAQEEFDRLKITSKVLQEQLDILGSPMTPPTNDQERALLDSLKNPAPQVAQVPDAGNGFAANQTPNTNAPGAIQPISPDNGTASTTNAPDTNAAPAMASTPPDTNAPDTSTNTPPATAMNDTNTTATPASTNVASTQVTPDTVTPATVPPTDTNTASSTPPAPDTNAATATTDTNAAPSMPTTNSVATTPTPDTNAAPPAPSTNSMASTPPESTNSEATPSAPTTNTATADTNSPTTTQLPPATTVYQDTTIKNNGDTNAAPAQTPDDTTEYATKPRLPDDMRDTAQQAADLFKMQRYDEAADKYQSIIDKYPESLYAWSNLGVVRFQQGKLPEALRALQQAVKLSPTDAFSYSNLGIVYYQMGQYENAISALERALALDPSNAKSHNYLGCACSQKGWTEVAEKEFLKAIEIDDTFGDAHFNLALVYATEKPPSLEMARRHYKRALELGIAQDPRLEKLLQMNGGVGYSQPTGP
jgi:Flp pilus assembly protein TadD